ncbi:MAG: hypothetical protein Q9172_000624 [Xanthocarpia lactea]
MADQKNTLKPSPDDVKTQDGVKKPEEKKPSIDLLESQPSITVKVGAGDGATVWNLPKALLTHVSPFFAAALDGPWLESAANSIDMVEDDPAAFRFFLHWLFTWMVGKSGEFPTTISVELETYAYLRAWVLGDKLGCPRFQDFAYAHLHRAQPRSPRLAREIYSTTPGGSKIRQYMTDLIVSCMRKDILTGVWEDVITEVEDLAIDIVRYQMRNTKPSNDDFLLVSSWTDFVF